MGQRLFIRRCEEDLSTALQGYKCINREIEHPEELDRYLSFDVGIPGGRKLLYEDATPYLLLKELLLGFQSNTYIKHVLIDEAQDYSSFQFEFIKRLFPAAKLTVLGDFNQAIFAHAQHHVDFNTLSTLYGADETIAVKLDQSYRSTRPIIDFTRELVPDGEQIIPFERQGKSLY